MSAVAKDGGNFVPQLQRVIVRFRSTGRDGRHTSCASPQQTFQTSHIVHRLLRECYDAEGGLLATGACGSAALPDIGRRHHAAAVA